MKKIYLFLFALIIIIIGCTQKETEKVDVEAAKQAMLDADRAFSEFSTEVGMRESFSKYMTDDATHYVDKQHPVTGREDILALFPSGDAQQGNLVWEPTYADISASGDMGYTLGRWDFMMTDSLGEENSVGYGYYVSIWKKQADGSWKYVFDTGINGPEDGEDEEEEYEDDEESYDEEENVSEDE